MSLTIKKSTFYFWIYTLALLTPFLIRSFEVNVFLTTFYSSLLLFGRSIKLSKTFTTTLMFLIGVLGVSFLSHFFYKNAYYNIIKDFVYLTKPIIYLCFGYLVATKIRNKDYIFQAIIYLGIILAFMHIFRVLSFLVEHKTFQINEIRHFSGKDNLLELMACSLLVLNNRNRFFSIKLKYKKVLYFVLALSFILYLSRTMAVTFIIILLTVKGYMKLSRKAITFLFSFLLGVVVFYKILNSIDIERGATGIEGFLYKLKIAPSEIFNAEINFDDPTQRWDHWRAYEASKAIDQVIDTKYSLGLFFGKGLGSLVDLGFVAPLGNDKMQYIPKIHNGYVYILFKSGLVGLVFYLLFFNKPLLAVVF